ncbi:alpha/beta hydrolase [Schlesneria sp.]|uniref:alpha/beta hydrolase n=1 Tax=Schlesneria sp. TaxID=2762018 RepID=UPI002EFCEBCC
MPLHPEAAAFLEQVARQKAYTFETVPVETLRRAAALGCKAGTDLPDLATVKNLTIEGPDGDALPIRVYVPRGDGPFGVCLYFHGGGWVLNNLDTHDDLVRHLTAESGCIFVNVDYRLAPEHKFPAAIEDAYASLKWVHANPDQFGWDPHRIAVAGDSAGANLAAVVCLMSRDRGGPPVAFQSLIYPITDCDFERPSYHENADGYFLTRKEMGWFWDQYVSSAAQRQDPYASPLRATTLKGLPPASIITAEYDPLRDEGEAYGAALQAAGIPVTLHRYEGMIHAFLRRVQQFETARDAIKRIGQQLRSAIGTK